LEEADQLADRIAVIDHGLVIEQGRGDELKRQIGGGRLEIVVEREHVDVVRKIVEQVAGTVLVDEDLRQISAPVTTGTKARIEAVKAMDDAGISPLDLGLKRPSLDDVFLLLTGHVAEDDSKDEVKADSRAGKGRR